MRDFTNQETLRNCSISNSANFLKIQAQERSDLIKMSSPSYLKKLLKIENKKGTKLEKEI